MKELIARIDEEFASSPVDGCCVLSIDDWKIIKDVLTSHDNIKSDTISGGSHV